MVDATPFTLREDYWESFEVQDVDIEFLYNFLLEKETPMTGRALAEALVGERIRLEKIEIERQRRAGGETYFPKGHYQVGASLVFPSLGWRQGKVLSVRPGENPDMGDFEVIQVAFEGGEAREYAAGLEDHKLNTPPQIEQDNLLLDLGMVFSRHGEDLTAVLEDALDAKDDFVRIAGKWFVRALLVDINVGHLNLAEAVLDMASGGPLPTNALLEHLGLSQQENANLTAFSLDLALQEDPRFDEVGSAGEILWFLNRLEPEGVLKPHLCLRYHEVDYARSLLTPEMLSLERELDDELTPFTGKAPSLPEVELTLNYPHWRAGVLPLSSRVRSLFPTAYEAPRIRFVLVDGDNGNRFPGWVVRPHRFVYGLQSWYAEKGVIPGSLIRVQRGKIPGEVIVRVESRRSSRDWIRTVLVGSDGGIVFAMLKQTVSTSINERMAIAVPDPEALDLVWENIHKEHAPFEKTLVNIVRELVKLTPQSHVHASELYAAVNTVRRCPPGPILALLGSRPWFIHVGDLHFRFDDSERS